MNITRGKIPSAIRVGIYGTEGVGKTTFASHFPGVGFIDTEGSTARMDVARFPPPKTLNDVLKDIDEVIAHPEGIGTLVIDTVDWLEKLIYRAVCEEKKIDNLEDLGYGKGYVYAKAKMQQVLEKLDQVIAKNVHVVLVCHAMIRKFELPDELGAYDRYTLKLNEKNIAPLIREWVDMLLFVNYRTDIVTDSGGKKMKGRGGQKRIMYTTHTACWDAKNRFDLPEELPFEYDKIAYLFGEAPPIEAAEPVDDEPEATPVEQPEEAPALAEVPEAQPEEDPATLFDPPPAPATVTTTESVPAVSKGKKKKEEHSKERPASMRSDDPAKDALLARLWTMMWAEKVYDPMVVQAVVAEKGYYDLSVEIRDYDVEFIEGCLIEAWESVARLCLSRIHNLPF